MYSVSVRCGALGCANYVRVAEDGVGDLLLFPVFYAEGRNYSRISLVNNSSKFGVVALVTLKSSGCSELLANFLVYLTPMDSWVGYIREEKGKIAVVSQDNSVLSKGKIASEESPFVLPLGKPRNPADVPNVGYVEVKTLAYVNTEYVDPGNSTVTYPLLMRDNGFTEEHMFMQWLFREGKDRYDEVAYFNNTDNFTGIIFPADEHKDFYGNNPVVKNGVVDPEFEDGVLSGFMEVVIPEYGEASYPAVAVKDYSMLGDDVLKRPAGFRYERNFNANYKPRVEDAAYLDEVGYVDLLDAALAKSRVSFHYYGDRVSSSAAAFLVFPTKELAYDPTTKRCVATEHTSGVWQEGLRLEQHVIDMLTVSDKGEARRCAFSPCVWSDTAMLSVVGADFGFDPFIYKSGTVNIYLSSEDPGYMQFFSGNALAGRKWSDVKALPVVVVVCFLRSDAGFSLLYPWYVLPGQRESGSWQGGSEGFPFSFLR